MANAWYNVGKKLILDSTCDLLNDTIKVLLVQGTYGFDADHLHVSQVVGDPNTKEVTGGSYARWTLGSKSVSQNDTSDYASFTGDNAVYSNVIAQVGTIKYIILYKHDGADDTANHLIAFIDTATGLPLTANGSDITVQWDTTGILHIT